MIRARKLIQFANGDLSVPKAHHYEGLCGCCCDKDEARKCFFAATVEAGAITGAANGDCSTKTVAHHVANVVERDAGNDVAPRFPANSAEGIPVEAIAR